MTRGTRPLWPIAALLTAGALLALPSLTGRALADPGREAITSILKELGVDPGTLDGTTSGGGETPENQSPRRAPGSGFTEAQRREIETIVDDALASRGILPVEGVGAVRVGAATGGSLVDATAPRALLAVLSRYGAAEEGVVSHGAPFIIGAMDGVRYRLDFNDCPTAATCRDVMFTANFNSMRPSLEFLNVWNLEHRYGVATRDEEGVAWLRMPVNLHGGVSEANWSDTVDWWRIAAFDFREALQKEK